MGPYKISCMSPKKPRDTEPMIAGREEYGSNEKIANFPISNILTCFLLSPRGIATPHPSILQMPSNPEFRVKLPASTLQPPGADLQSPDPKRGIFRGEFSRGKNPRSFRGPHVVEPKHI